LTWALWR